MFISADLTQITGTRKVHTVAPELSSLTKILEVDEGTAQDEQPGQREVRLDNHIVLRCERTGNLAVPNAAHGLENVGIFSRRDEARCRLEGRRCPGDGGHSGGWADEGRCAERGDEKGEDG